MEHQKGSNASSISKDRGIKHPLDVKGPVPIQHMNRLGHCDGVNNVQNAGVPSKESSVRNGKGNW